MADKPKIGYEEATAYLKACKPGLTLGAWIGGGGFGDVYELRGADRSMVVKIMDTRHIIPGEANAMKKKQRNEVKKNFTNEVTVMKLLNDCPNIMPLLDDCDAAPLMTDETGMRDYSICVKLLFMPKLVPLKAYIGNRAMSEAEALRLLRDITTALSACADQQITHFDLKPDNIFVDLTAEAPRYVLGDFGICRWAGKTGKLHQKLRGYTPYRAPECLSGQDELGTNVDLYSLGVVVYECLGQKLPYPKNAGVKDLQIPVIKHISQDLFDILTLMLQRDPAKRCSHPKNLLEQLDYVSQSGSGRASHPEYAPEVRRMLLDRDLDGAIRAAREGIRNQEASCVRLLALAVFNQSSGSMRGYQQALKILADQCLEEDMASIFLRGYFSGRLRDWRIFVRDLKTAAEAGYIPACYLFGRTLLYEDCSEYCYGPELGMEYLIRAAEADYFPALRLVKREIEDYPQLQLSDTLRRRLREEFLSEDPRNRTALYDWL